MWNATISLTLQLLRLEQESARLADLPGLPSILVDQRLSESVTIPDYVLLLLIILIVVVEIMSFACHCATRHPLESCVVWELWYLRTVCHATPPQHDSVVWVWEHATRVWTGVIVYTSHIWGEGIIYSSKGSCWVYRGGLLSAFTLKLRAIVPDTFNLNRIIVFMFINSRWSF